MKIDGIPTRTLRARPDQRAIDIIDQTRLPHALHWVRVATLDEAAHAIRAMQVRGAPLIGATAAYGLAIALDFEASDTRLAEAIAVLGATRPTAVNLHWALARMEKHLRPLAPEARCDAAWAEAAAIAEEDVAQNAAIGQHGLKLWKDLIVADGQTLNVMTHCNAGWLATVDWGTALAPIFKATEAGIPVHVWVDETRPRNQGASLTAWELVAAGIPHHLIVDNAGGHLMQHGRVDLCIVGTDRTTASGDVCNKIGTYLKALAAKDNGVPFYVSLPGSTVDWTVDDGVAEIPIEERGEEEVLQLMGCDAGGQVQRVSIAPAATPAVNPAFDVTPARLVSGLITERGICAASREGLLGLYPEQRR